MNWLKIHPAILKMRYSAKLNAYDKLMFIALFARC